MRSGVFHEKVGGVPETEEVSDLFVACLVGNTLNVNSSRHVGECDEFVM